MTAPDLDAIRNRVAIVSSATSQLRAMPAMRALATVDAPALLAALEDEHRANASMAQAIANHVAAAGDEWEDGVKATLAWLRTQIDQRPAFSWYIAELLDEAQAALIIPSDPPDNAPDQEGTTP